MKNIELNMPNSPPPPTYEEAVLCSVDPHLRQNHAHHKKDQSPSRQTSDNKSTDPPKLVLTSSHPSLAYTHADNPCVVNLMDSPTEEFTTGSDSLNYINTPAIIIHSAISTPGDDECNYFDKFSSSDKNSPVNEKRVLPNENQNKKVPSISGNIQETGNSPKVDIELNLAGRIKKDKNGANVSYHNITKDHSSIIYDSEVGGWKRGATEACRECRKTNGVDRRSSIATDNAKSGKVVAEISAISRTRNTHPRFYSQESLIRKHQQDSVLNSEISNSIDEAWCKKNRIRADSVTSSPNMRQRSGTLDGNSMPFNQNFKMASELRNSTFVIMPARSNVSKSYNDLSSRHLMGCRRESYCDRNLYRCPQCHCSSTRDCRCYIAPKSHKQPHLSSSRVNRSVEENRISKHHLLPDSRNGHGTRGIRSVSVDDVRMRGGLDEYEWKDGKVQLKNGGITHCESVRYVWKDGHVEKITSDANNVSK